MISWNSFKIFNSKHIFAHEFAMFDTHTKNYYKK